MTQHSTSRTPPLRTVGDPGAPSRRLHHLDALRGGALLLGVLLHALMPFVPGLPWVIVDSRSSEWTLLGVGVIHLFRMTLFMMLAGYFGHLVLHQRGVRSYLRDRAKRIALPLAGFWPVVFALVVGALVLHEILRGPEGVTEMPPPPAGAPPGILALPTLHLWFLLLLMETVLVVVAARGLLMRVLGTDRAAALSRRLAAVLSSPAGVLVAAVPYAAGLLAQGHDAGGIAEPTTLMPVAGASIAYTGAFLTGWFLRAYPEALARVERQWLPHLVAAGVLSAASVLLHVTGSPGPTSAPVTALAGWTWVYGLLGLSARLLDREIPAVRYLADASYWIYLLHFPLLLLVEAPLADLGVPIAVKLLIALVVVVGALLLSYDLLVRSTWIGAWLNGHRRPRALRLPGRSPGGDR